MYSIYEIEEEQYKYIGSSNTVGKAVNVVEEYFSIKFKDLIDDKDSIQSYFIDNDKIEVTCSSKTGFVILDKFYIKENRFVSNM